MADCAFYEIDCQTKGWIDDLTGDMFTKLENWVVESAIGALKWAILAWVRTPTPTVDSNSGAVAYLLAYTYPVSFVLATISLLFMAARLAWSQRGEDLVEIGKSLVTFVGITTLGVAVASTLTVAGDSYSRWILESSLGLGKDPSDTQLTERAAQLLNLNLDPSSVADPSGQALTGLALVIAFFFLILTSVILIFLTWIRGVILALLAGGLAVAASLAMTQGGKHTLSKYIGWFIAWEAFRPATSSAMAASFWMFGTGDTLDMFGGIGLFGMTVFMLPFLLRLVVPAAAGFGGGGGAGALLSAGAAGAVPVATWLAGRSGGDSGDSSSTMSVRDVSQGPSGSSSAPTGPPSPQSTAKPAPTAGGGAAGTAGTGVAGASAGGAASTAAAGAATGGVAAGVAVAGQLAQVGRQAARGTAAAATGEEA